MTHVAMQLSVGVPSPPRAEIRSYSASPDSRSASAKAPWLKLFVGSPPSDCTSITVEAVPYLRSTSIRGLLASSL